MPNSTKPFVLSWASSTPITPSTSPANQQQSSSGGSNGGGPQPAFPKEYSIFVGDLAPEASNSDLVAVFRNPVLGLRSDREPKFIRPFLSCKSAKIMLDPVTGVSRGYGFVRFTDEADQQRALIEMHGLYCLSRPMRISPATAKFKPGTQVAATEASIQGALQQPQSIQPQPVQPQPVQLQLVQPQSVQPQPAQPQPVQAQGQIQQADLHPLALSLLKKPTPAPALYSPTPLSTRISQASVSSAEEIQTQTVPASVLNQIVQIAGEKQNASSPTNANTGTATLNSITAQFAAPVQKPIQVGTTTDDTWKHQQQVRAILSNLIGPNGEQLTSTDPYNTTVFVGGLSPLIQEETLRTFFAPFGDIHYVKVPVGKHCGFVQFVRKADAERAIEKMQGFSIGGSRIRLSWGRSQCALSAS
jgi:RNA recognition motif-containing protein